MKKIKTIITISTALILLTLLFSVNACAFIDQIPASHRSDEHTPTENGPIPVEIIPEDQLISTEDTEKDLNPADLVYYFIDQIPA